MVYEKSCKNCYFCDMCLTTEPCGDYSPIGEFAEEVFMLEEETERRYDFLNDWIDYVEDDALFF